MASGRAIGASAAPASALRPIVDPDSGKVLRTIESTNHVTGVTFVDGELRHAARGAAFQVLERSGRSAALELSHQKRALCCDLFRGSEAQAAKHRDRRAPAYGRVQQQEAELSAEQVREALVVALAEREREAAGDGEVHHQRAIDVPFLVQLAQPEHDRIMAAGDGLGQSRARVAIDGFVDDGCRVFSNAIAGASAWSALRREASVMTCSWMMGGLGTGPGEGASAARRGPTASVGSGSGPVKRESGPLGAGWGSREDQLEKD